MIIFVYSPSPCKNIISPLKISNFDVNSSRGSSLDTHGLSQEFNSDSLCGESRNFEFYKDSFDDDKNCVHDFCIVEDPYDKNLEFVHLFYEGNELLKKYKKHKKQQTSLNFETIIKLHEIHNSLMFELSTFIFNNRFVSAPVFTERLYDFLKLESQSFDECSKIFLEKDFVYPLSHGQLKGLLIEIRREYLDYCKKYDYYIEAQLHCC